MAKPEALELLIACPKVRISTPAKPFWPAAATARRPAYEKQEGEPARVQPSRGERAAP